MISYQIICVLRKEDIDYEWDVARDHVRSESDVPQMMHKRRYSTIYFWLHKLYTYWGNGVKVKIFAWIDIKRDDTMTDIW